MKRILAALCALMIAAPAAYAAQGQSVDKLLDAEPVASLGTVTTAKQNMQQALSIDAIGVLATSVSGVADIKIEYLLSYDGAVFTAASDFTDITSSTAAGCPTPEGVCVISLPPDLSFAPSTQFKITGVGTNPADTIVTLWFVTTK